MVRIEEDLEVPDDIWDNLYEHQKTGVKWLWELHQLRTGGILGDEMGLGKTIQMIAFLTALKSSNVANFRQDYENLGPVVLVCPATVMYQWLLEFNKWWPEFKVAILHSTGSFTGSKKNLVQKMNKASGIIICSYPGVVIYQDYLHSHDWHYVILDEGHKIRNPDAQVTLACKRFRTPHRIILSGSPVQNNLKELWSIFDFIYPGKLGTLPVFMEQFAIPITQGGYANASDIQVQIAYKCSCVLRDTIKPFLLRRTKAEVNSKLKLPDRSEQVLFCKLTDTQRKMYEAYLGSPTIRDIKNGLCQIFVGLFQLRKICNHPDLFDATESREQLKQKEKLDSIQHPEFFSAGETYGHHTKSGKMMVVDALLKLWKKQGHKVLLFTQSRMMVRIFMNYLEEMDYKYLQMDGGTAIGSRHSMIDEFNNNEDIFVFLLTTRVGGVGVNLIGANRVIIYDPDWNPSTDIQARERAWRIGQQRHVIIYRLLTAGTIEEKIYHRQIFKLYLSNRVLKDAKQKRFFKTNDLHELFTLGDNDKNIETKALFDDSLQINPEAIKRAKQDRKARKKKRKSSGQSALDEDDNSQVDQVLSDEKIQAMRDRARRLSNMIALQYGSSSNNSGGQTEGDQVRIKLEPGLCSDSIVSVQEDGMRIKTEVVEDASFLPPIAAAAAAAGPSRVVELEEGEIISKASRVKLEESSKEKEKRHKKSTKVKKSDASKQHVEYLVRQDIYRPGDEHEAEAESRPSEKHDKRYKRDDYILERLFKNSNIFGALKHDLIEGDSNADFKVVESEAEKVARDAIRALRESRRLCLDPRAGVPNWTGRNGQMASQSRLVPKNKSRLHLHKISSAQSTSSSSSSGLATTSSNGENSNSLLAAIKRRNQSNPILLNQNTASLDYDEEDDNRDFRGKARDAGAENMADMLRDFFLFKSSKSGQAQTDELLDFFKKNFKPDKTAIFKALLYKMCELHRKGDKGFWSIKSEFRDM